MARPTLARQYKIRTKPTANLAEFFERYQALLQCIAWRVDGNAAIGTQFTTTEELIDFCLNTMRHESRKVWGHDLKAWRVASMLRNAGFLGAFHALGVRSVRGKGYTVLAEEPPRRRKPFLRVVK